MRTTLLFLLLAGCETTSTPTHDAGASPTTSTAPAGTLPAELAGVSMKLTGTPRAGSYLVSGLTTSAFAVDETGAVTWAHELGGTQEETKLQTDGTFTTTVGTSEGWQPVATTYARYTPDGTLLGTYTATSPDPSESGAPVYGDVHELLVTKDTTEHLHLLAYELRPLGATNSTPTAWHELVRQAPDGTVELRWKSWSRFTADDITESIPVPGAADADHTNAIAIDPTDGNYVVSFRDLDALVKIDYTTGAVIWQLGGKQSDFTIVGDPLGGFSGQHSVQILDDGHVLIYDNGLAHVPQESRAVEYALDTTAKTATMVWQYRHSPAIFTIVVGSVERHLDGHTLVAFANAGVVDEVDASGTMLWEGQLVNEGVNAAAYRVRFLPSLTSYERP